MAQSRKSEGMCEKIHNAVSPFRSRRIRRTDESSLNKMIPVEFNHSSAQNSKKLVAPAVQFDGKEKRGCSVNKVEEFDDREILIVRGQKFTKHVSIGRPNHARFGKARSYKDGESIHEGRFSDYISKVKNRMIKTVSNVDKTISFN